MRLVLEKRPEASTRMAFLSPVIAILLTLVTGGIIFALRGLNPFSALYVFFVEPLTTSWSIEQLILKATPLAMIGAGLAVSCLANVWNIGAEGQLTAGAILGSAIPVFFPEFQSPLTLVLMLSLGVIGGMAWAAIPAYLKNRFGTAAYAAEEWYPSRIAFGQHKGRSVAEARTDAGLRRWLDGLAQSANARNARMGRWYLRELQKPSRAPVFVAWESAGGSAEASVTGSGLVVYVNPELQQLRVLVEAARGRLAELDAGFVGRRGLSRGRRWSHEARSGGPRRFPAPGVPTLRPWRHVLRPI